MHEARRKDYLSAMGITQWQRRDSGDRVEVVQQPAITPELTSSSEPILQVTTGGDLQSLAAAVSVCKKCQFSRSRTQAVFGMGNTQPKLMIIGEEPGIEEDRSGEPFTGAAGQLFDNMLRAMGLSREQIYITNIVKCHPAENHKPGVEELAACREHLDQQIAFLKPQILLAMGAISAQAMLQVNTPVSRMRGITHAYGQAGIPLHVTYHPAYLLRKPEEKAKVWADLQLLMGVLC